MGFKVNSVYGGHSSLKDKIYLLHKPAILIGTPGRVASHIHKGTFETKDISYLVLDEFDKALEFGFEKEMKELQSDISNNVSEQKKVIDELSEVFKSIGYEI